MDATTGEIIGETPLMLDASSTATVTWSASPSGIVSLSSNGNQVTASKIGNGIVTLIAHINDCTNFTVSRTIDVGTPPKFDDISCVLNFPWSFPKNYCTNTDYYFFAAPRRRRNLLGI